MVETDLKASDLARVFTPVPQSLINVRFSDGQTPLETEQVQDAISTGEKALGDNGRLLIRKSGTEPLIRVMGECTDEALLNSVLSDVVEAVKSATS